MTARTVKQRTAQTIPGQTALTPAGGNGTIEGPAKRRRPVEMIAGREAAGEECERKVRKALAKLVKTGAPFSVEDVIALSGIGKTFIYDRKRRPKLTDAVLMARDASQALAVQQIDSKTERQMASWRERATAAEALAKQLRDVIKERDARISDLTGQLYDPDGTHLADENAQLRKLITGLNENLRKAQIENQKLRRSLDGSRSNLKHERERNVADLIAFRQEQAPATE
jgi:uncharacterized membrane-anchored protein YjiN (DUF445 family)